MNPHPRLFVTPDHLERLRQPSDHPAIVAAANEVERLAETFAASRTLHYNPDLHNALLSRAREMQTRVFTLLVQWRRSGNDRFRDAVMDHIRDMAAWEHWCWEAQVLSPDPHRAINRLYDLSSGENSLTLALAYDLMEGTLTGSERAVFVELARRRCFEPFLTVIASQPAPPGEWLPGWWFKRAHTNWNTVCAGGAGLLALALWDEAPDLAPSVLAAADESVRAYFQTLAATNGGWVEGIGYWNYGHRYGFLYLLGHERATGAAHPCLSWPGVRETLSFPLDFTPNGQFCSFPDVNIWWPLPFHYEASLRLGHTGLIAELDRRQPPPGNKARTWPDDAELLLFHPRRVPAATDGVETQVARLYPSMDWALLADRLPEPRLCMTIRGGSTTDPHSMVDVLSFHVVVGAEKMIENSGNRGGDDYLETTFSARRNDIFEIGQPSKNVLFINGVGLPAESRVETCPLTLGSAKGLRLDATAGFGLLGQNSPMAEFCARLFLLLEPGAFLIVDRFELPQYGRVETRMHTHAAAQENAGRSGFLLTGASEHMQVTYASTVDSVTATGVTCPTKPVPGANVLRWCTVTRTNKHITMATLLTPGDAVASLSIRESEREIEILAASAGWRERIVLTPRLLPPA